MSRGWLRPISRGDSRRERLQREVDRELAFHLAEKTRELEEEGLAPEAAAAEARRQFGDLSRWRRAALTESRRTARAERGRGILEDLRLDAYAALRQLVRRPGFALLTVAVLAAGVGTSTAVWAALDAVLFRPPPFPGADRIVAISGTTPRFPSLGVSPANYLDWKAGQSAFEAMAAARAGTATLYLDRPVRVGALRVESDFFDVVGVDPRLGRRLLPGDDRADAPPVAVLSHGLWTGAFGADPDVVGRTVRVGDDLVTVVGVMPEGFRYLDLPVWGGPERDLLLSDPFQGDRTSRWTGGTLWPVGRIAAGVGIEEADARLDAVARGLAEAYPDINGAGSGSGVLSVRLDPLKRFSAMQIRGDLLLIGGAALVLIAVVGVSVAGLLLARVLDRRRELAVRASLGAGRGRLVRHVMLEIGLLCAMGAAGGMALAALAIDVVVALAPGEVPWLDTAAIDHRVLLGGMAVTALLWIGAGLPAAIGGAGLDLRAWLKEGAPVVSGQRRRGRVVIVGQLALACALLSVAGIVLATYARLTQVSPGVRTENTAVLRLQLPRARYAPRVGTVGELGRYEALNEAWREQEAGIEVYDVGAEARDLVRRVSEGLGAIPGVRGVAFANYPPLSGPSVWGTRLPLREGDPPDAEPMAAYQQWVSTDYFEVLGIPIRRGRAFTARDGPEDTPVVVVSEAFADRYLEGGIERAVGATVAITEDPFQAPVERTVVGVVGNVLHGGPHEPDRLTVYIPLAQRMRLWNRHQVAFPLRATFIVRTEGDPRDAVAALREAVWAADPELPIEELRTLDELSGDLMAEPRFYLWLLGSFAVVALLLAATGTLGLLSQRMHQRTREMGIRRALGASADAVMRLVLREGAALALVGVAIGLGASWALRRVLAARVPGVEGWTPGVQVAVAGLLVATAVVASWAPARRAARVDPMDAVRGE